MHLWEAPNAPIRTYSWEQFKMKYLINLILLLSLFSTSVQANDNEPLIEILVVAKSTGMCGSLKQLAAFQESTKMADGDEFILSFFNTEAARLGLTLPEFLKQCEDSLAIYTKTMDSLGYEK